jgi:hypothetical protein
MTTETTISISMAGSAQESHRTIKDHVREHLSSLPVKIQFCVTITLKQHRVAYDKSGAKYIQKLTEDEAGRVAERFMIRLNERVLKRRYKQFGESLFFVPVLEAGSKSGRLHLHIAIGNVPRDVSWFAMKHPIHKALDGLEWIDDQVFIDCRPDEQAVGSYLTKTVKKNSDMILWERTPEKML